MLVQAQIINRILATKNSNLLLSKGLTKEYFPQYKAEFDFLLNHYKKYNQVPDTTTFLKVFPNFEIFQVDEAEDYLISEIYRERNENVLAKTFNNIRELLMNGKTDEAINVLNKSASTISVSKDIEAVNILEDISRYDEYVDKCNNFEDHFVSTGFKELDDSFGGGIDRDNAYFVISARAGIGKTLVMIKFATAAVQKGLRVGLYEGEMTVNKIAGRYDTLTSHISNTAITHGGAQVANAYKNYLDNLKSSNGKFFILTRDMIKEDKMTVDILRAFVEKYELDILFVDQLSLLDSTSKSNKSFEQAAEISKALKNLQVQKHIPIIVASQQNRTSLEEGGLAGTQNLSLSDRIGQDATEVLFISKKDNIMTFNIAKARDGAKKYELSYEVDYDKGIFNYVPDEEDLKNGYDEDSVVSLMNKVETDDLHIIGGNPYDNY